MVSNSKDRTWIIVIIFAFISMVVDAIDLQILSLSLPQLMQEFNITKIEGGALGTWSLIGMAIGGISGGWLADRFGRVRTMSWMMILFSVGTALLAFTQTYEQFLVIRVISSIGLGAEYIVASMLVAEYVPTKKRTTVLGTVQAGWSVGYLIAALLAGPILESYGWRPLFLITVLPVVLAIYMRLAIPEPQGWRQNDRKEPDQQQKKNEWALIFKDRKTRVTFILWAFTAAFLQFGYYGVANWLPTYLVSELGLDFKNMASYLIGTYTAMIIGKLITGWLADKFGRRIMYAIGGISTAIALPLIIIFQNPGNIVFLLTLFGFLYGMQYAVNATYLSESFPTNIRGTAVGASYNIGKLGAAVAPITIGMIATNYSIGYGLALLGVTYALSGIIPVLFIREKMYEPFTEQSQKENNCVEKNKQMEDVL
ncbi:MFS transporter [Peribacillus frigoritolerans]|uniref:MFS transporter n=1 Tax=Peribacillus frigoritolerans TaxID=450367 RepID=UPI003F7F60CB